MFLFLSHKAFPKTKLKLCTPSATSRRSSITSDTCKLYLVRLLISVSCGLVFQLQFFPDFLSLPVLHLTLGFCLQLFPDFLSLLSGVSMIAFNNTKHICIQIIAN